MRDSQSFSDAIVKHINYFSEEYIKQLLEGVDSLKVETLKPFVSSIIFPGSLFPDVDANVPTEQYAATTYVGLMQMVFPEATSDLEDLPAFTLLEFNLDGVERKFITVAGGSILAGVTSFDEFVQSLYPTANEPIPFNESAIHVLRNVRISGSKFDPSSGAFINTGFISGAHTVDYKFCISVSGYSAILL